MDKKVFAKFRTLIYDSCGIHLTEQKEALVTARVSKRMRALGISDFQQYIKIVESDSSGKELGELINAISTNVTHFYREKRHFDFLAEKLQNRPTNEGPLKIWCAASSSGEEPYTLAITALENANSNVKINIVASDISTKVLQMAKFGVYRTKDVETIPNLVLKRYFQKGVGKAESLFKIKSQVKDLVDFRQINLSTPPYPLDGPFDFIFCRNVMIYFNNELRKILVDNMVSLLKPGGHLCVGMAESLSGVKHNLSSVEPSVYIKKG